MSIQEKLLPEQSIVALTEILNQRTIWERRGEFTYNVWNLCGRLYRGIFPEDESDELSKGDMERIKKLSQLVHIVYIDGLGYTVENTKELYEASGVMIALTELNSLLSLAEKVTYTEENEDDAGSP